MQGNLPMDEFYAITKALADYLPGFVEKIESRSPIQFDGVGGETPDKIIHIGFVTLEPRVEHYGVTFDRRIVIGIYNPDEKACKVFSFLGKEESRLGGVILMNGDVAPNALDLAAIFIKAAYENSIPGEDVFASYVDIALSQYDSLPSYPVCGPRDLYAFTSRLMVALMQSMRDSQAKNAVDELGFAQELAARPDGEGWERVSLEDFRKQIYTPGGVFLAPDSQVAQSDPVPSPL